MNKQNARILSSHFSFNGDDDDDNFVDESLLNITQSDVIANAPKRPNSPFKAHFEKIIHKVLDDISKHELIPDADDYNKSAY